jgi:hypothetical protein
VTPVLFLASACLDAGDYRGGGRRIEDPGMADVAEDALDHTATDDALSEDAGASQDASPREDGALADASMDAPRSEPPSNLDDSGRLDPDGSLADVAPVDAVSEDARTDAPPSWPDATSADAMDPRDGAVDMPIRDVTAERRD